MLARGEGRAARERIPSYVLLQRLRTATMECLDVRVESAIALN